MIAIGLYSLAPGFCISLAFIIVISLLTKPPVPAVYEEFERAAVKPIFEEQALTDPQIPKKFL
jgi:Na+/proline symporter